MSTYLLENGNLLRSDYAIKPDIIIGAGDTGRVEMFDWNGTRIWNFVYANSTQCIHHDIEPLPNGNILMIAWELKTRDDAIDAGCNPEFISDEIIWPDHIIEVEPNGPESGNIVWEWHVWDHLIQDYDPSKDKYGIVSDHPELIDINFMAKDSGRDWNHINSIDYHEGFDQILLSACAQAEIWVIDHSTTTEEASGHTGGKSGRGGDLLYRWGNPQYYRAGDVEDKKFYGQHDARWIEPGCPGEGHITVFHNGFRQPGENYSSVIEIVPPVDNNGNYYLEPGSAFGPDEPIWIYTAPNPTDFYASGQSGAQRLPNGNTLICSANGVFFEITYDKNIVWIYFNLFPIKFIGWNNLVFKINRYPLDYPGIGKLSIGIENKILEKENTLNPKQFYTNYENNEGNIIDVDGDGGADYVRIQDELDNTIEYKAVIINNGSLSGFVNDSFSSTIEGAVVRITCGGYYLENTSNSSGYYYIGNIPIVDCYWNVSASKTGYRTTSLDMSIDENTTYDFILMPLGKTLYVGGHGPNNYSSIQSAIDASNSGDVVFVYDSSSPYYEHIIVDESIDLIGENKETTVIDAQKDGTPVRIVVDDCLISNFTILNCEDHIDQDWGDAIIKIERGNNVVIKDNILNAGIVQTTSYNDYGALDLNGSTFCTIINNYITQDIPDSYTSGIGLHKNSSNNIISGNNISHFQFGIHNEDVGINHDNIISENHIHHNEFGISIANGYNEILNNIVEYNIEVGINIQSGYHNTISGNIIRYNGAGEKFHCGIELMGYNNNKNNYVSDNVISNNIPCGLQTEYSHRNIITKNNFIDNYGDSGAPEKWWGNAYVHVQDGFFKKDSFKNNYWSDSFGIFPKIIQGYLEIMRTSITIEWINIDWHPAREPYDIPVPEV